MKIRTLFFLLFLCRFAYSQQLNIRPDLRDFYLKMDELSFSENQSDFEDVLQSPFFNSHFSPVYLLYADWLAERSQFEKAEKYYILTAENKIISLKAFERQYRKAYWKENLEGYEKLRKKLIEIENELIQKITQREKDLYDTVCVYFSRDQKTRQKDYDSMTKEDFKNMRTVDSLNIYGLVRLMKENPDIDFTKLGWYEYETTSKVSDIRLHCIMEFPAVWYDFFEKRDRERIEKGEGYPYTYAFAYDRILFGQRKPSYYGTFTASGWYELKKTCAEPNLEEINQHRREIGLFEYEKEEANPDEIIISY